jgi:hypothetical protein
MPLPYPNQFVPSNTFVKMNGVLNPGVNVDPPDALRCGVITLVPLDCWLPPLKDVVVCHEFVLGGEKEYIVAYCATDGDMVPTKKKVAVVVEFELLPDKYELPLKDMA